MIRTLLKQVLSAIFNDDPTAAKAVSLVLGRYVIEQAPSQSLALATILQNSNENSPKDLIKKLYQIFKNKEGSNN